MCSGSIISAKIYCCMGLVSNLVEGMLGVESQSFGIAFWEYIVTFLATSKASSLLIIFSLVLGWSCQSYTMGKGLRLKWDFGRNYLECLLLISCGLLLVTSMRWFLQRNRGEDPSLIIHVNLVFYLFICLLEKIY